MYYNRFIIKIVLCVFVTVYVNIIRIKGMDKIKYVNHLSKQV